MSTRDPLPAEVTLVKGVVPSKEGELPPPPGSPGVALSELRVPGSPTLPEWDPNSLALTIQRVANEYFGQSTPPPGDFAHVGAEASMPTSQGVPAALTQTPSEVPQGTPAQNAVAGPDGAMSPFSMPLRLDSLGGLEGPQLDNLALVERGSKGQPTHGGAAHGNPVSQSHGGSAPQGSAVPYGGAVSQSHGGLAPHSTFASPSNGLSSAFAPERGTGSGPAGSAPALSSGHGQQRALGPGEDPPHAGRHAAGSSGTDPGDGFTPSQANRHPVGSSGSHAPGHDGSTPAHSNRHAPGSTGSHGQRHGGASSGSQGQGGIMPAPTTPGFPASPSMPSPSHGLVPSMGVPSTGVPPNAPSTPSEGHPQGLSQAFAPNHAGATKGLTIESFQFSPLVPTQSLPSANTGAGFDPYAIRREFPILNEQVAGRPIVWLDNAATTQKPQAVIDRLKYFYEHENSNVHRAAHTLAARSSDAYEAARETVRRFINAPSSKEIVFVRGTTEGINLVAQSWGRRNVNAGDEIVITWLEHHANIVPWQLLCAEKGARLKVAPVDDRGQIILEEYEKLLGPRTKLVAIPQVSNALGTITPAKTMIELAHRHGAKVLLDGAQGISHMAVDVQSLDCDWYVFSGHKVFAPTGIGAVFGKQALLEQTPPWQGGGNMIQDVTFERTVYQPAPARFEAGTGNIADAVGLGAALDWLSRIGVENVGRYEHDLLEYGTGRLMEVPGLRMLGTAADKAGVLSFVLDGQKTEDMSAILDKEGIAVRSGHHCAQPILRRMGVESSVRASLAPYNTCEDLDALADALLRLQGGRRS